MMKYIIGRVLAVILGIILGFFGVFNSVFADGMLSERLIVVGVILLIYAFLGFLLGFFLPKGSWTWGLFGGVPGALFLLLYMLREFSFYYLIYIILLLTVSCLAAYGGSLVKTHRDNCAT